MNRDKAISISGLVLAICGILQLSGEGTEMYQNAGGDVPIEFLAAATLIVGLGSMVSERLRNYYGQESAKAYGIAIALSVGAIIALAAGMELTRVASIFSWALCSSNGAKTDAAAWGALSMVGLSALTGASMPLLRKGRKEKPEENESFTSESSDLTLTLPSSPRMEPL